MHKTHLGRRKSVRRKKISKKKKAKRQEKEEIHGNEARILKRQLGSKY